MWAGNIRPGQPCSVENRFRGTVLSTTEQDGGVRVALTEMQGTAFVARPRFMHGTESVIGRADAAGGGKVRQNFRKGERHAYASRTPGQTRCSHRSRGPLREYGNCMRSVTRKDFRKERNENRVDSAMQEPHFPAPVLGPRSVAFPIGRLPHQRARTARNLLRFQHRASTAGETIARPYK